jgi:hypothetical protein
MAFIPRRRHMTVKVFDQCRPKTAKALVSGKSPRARLISLSLSTVLGWMIGSSVFIAPAEAKEIFLTLRSRTYDSDVASIEVGDVVRLTEFRRTWAGLGKYKAYQIRNFIISEKLGEGSMTRVFGIQGEPDYVLRVPRSLYPIDQTFDSHSPPKMMKEMQKGAANLEKSDVSITRIVVGSDANFLVVEKATGPSLAEFVAKPENFSEQERKEMLEALKDFARSTWAFESIGDFNFSQVAYVREKHRWILHDWSNNHSLFQGEGSRTIFGRYFGYPWNDYYVEHIPRGERDASGTPIWSWFGRLLITMDAEIIKERIRRGYKVQTSRSQEKDYVEGGMYGVTRAVRCRALFSEI